MYPDELQKGAPITSEQEVVVSNVEFDVGEINTRFFKELRDNARIMGTRCNNCGITYVPPRNTCKECFEKLTDFTEVGQQGTVVTCTTVECKVANPPMDAPYSLVLVKLDGSDTALLHVMGAGQGEVKPGDRVRAVFADERRGDIRDIDHFEPA